MSQIAQPSPKGNTGLHVLLLCSNQHDLAHHQALHRLLFLTTTNMLERESLENLQDNNPDSSEFLHSCTATVTGLKITFRPKRKKVLVFSLPHLSVGFIASNL